MLLFTHFHVIPIQYAVLYPVGHKIEFLNILYSEFVLSRSKNVKKNTANDPKSTLKCALFKSSEAI